MSEAGLRTAPSSAWSTECSEEAQSRTVPAVNRFRGWPASPASADLGDWWTDMGVPLVYVTFGTVAVSMGLFPGLYRAAIAAVATYR